MKTNIKNMRCTIFIDKIIPFSAPIEEEVKKIFVGKQLTSILLQDLMLPQEMFQSWGLVEKNLYVLQLRGNKIDFFSNSDFSSEKDFCTFCYEKILKLKEVLKINIRRLAFAPTYTIAEEFITQFIEANFKVHKFGTSSTQGFSLSRVFYRSETIEKYSYNINYNSNISLQNLNPFLTLIPFADKKQIIIEQDINTKDRGRQFFTDDEIKTFYMHIPNLNESYLKIFTGE